MKKFMKPQKCSICKIELINKSDIITIKCN